MIGGGVGTMELEIYQARSDLYFLLKGRVVLEECERLKQTCLPLINKGIEQVIVDLSKVDFIDSAGLGVLVGFKMASSKNKARIVLLQPSKPVADILYISKLDGIFDIVTGADADVLKAQTVQAHFRIGPSNAPAPAMPSSAGMAPPAMQRQQMIQPDRPSIPIGMPREAPSGAAGPPRMDTAFPDITVAAEERASASAAGEVKSQKEMIEDHCRRAVEYMRQGNYESSVEEYRKALEIDPHYLPAINNLAIVYEKQPSWINKAIEQWELVLQLSQSHADQKHVDRAQRHLASLRKMS